MKKFIKFIKQIALVAGILCIVPSCSKMNDLHDKYLEENEITYAAKVDSVSVRPGRDRAMMDIKINSQRIESVRIYWNDYLDSVDVAINNQVGSFSKILENMDENEFIFYLICFDKFGNRSLPFEASGIVYGDRYESGLSNRSLLSIYVDSDGSLIANLGGAPENALYTELKYTDTGGKERTVQIPVDQSSVSITGMSSDFRYRTLYKPEAAAIDTFYTAWRTANDIPHKYSTAGWTAECRDGNHDWGANGGEPFRVLDGDINTGWHSRPGTSLPQCLVVDMKASQEVRHIMLWHLPEGLASNWIYYKTIEVYLSDTPVTPGEYQSSWGTPAAKYQYPGGVDGITIEFAPNSKGRYMVLYFPDSSASTYISFAELDVFK